jgi:alkylation response protein AidB-like acyl-CoA dehydrogenase
MSTPFTLSTEQELIRETVRDFGENEIRPVASEYEAEQRYPYELLSAAGDLDLVAPNVPEEYGGAGMDHLAELIITEELWRADPGIGGSIAAARFGTEMLLKYGEEWMCEQWLPKITAGETPIATGISEAAHGSDVAGMETRAEKDTAEQSSASPASAEATQDGDEYVINGDKMWIRRHPTPATTGLRPFSRQPTSTATTRRESRTNSASTPKTPPRLCWTTCASPPRTSSARLTAASTS